MTIIGNEKAPRKIKAAHKLSDLSQRGRSQKYSPITINKLQLINKPPAKRAATFFG